MATKQKISAILVCGFLLSACAMLTKYQLQTVQLEKLEKLVTLSKGPCYGRCPVYVLTVYTNGVATFEGKQFTNREGLFITKLSETALRSLKSDLLDAKLNTFFDGYRSKLPDLQTVTITYYGTDYTKTIVGKDGRPEPVMKVQALLESIEQSSSWQLKAPPVAANPSKGTNTFNQMRIQLQADTDANAWVRKYGRQQMKIVKGLDIKNNIWLVTFNAERNDAKELLVVIQSDSQVISVELSR